MKVKLIGYTQSPQDELLDIKSAIDMISYCARVSNPNNQMNKATSDKLLEYLIKNKHWSPFEMVSATLEVETTRDIARQLLRHRSFAFQEFSQRYADSTDSLGFEVREARLQDLKNRQNSVELDYENNFEHQNLSSEWNNRQQQCIDLAKQNYKWAVDNGIAKEQARCVLPEGNTVSRLYIQGTIRSFIHYIEVRTHESTQLEHRELAKAVAVVIKQVFQLKQ